MTKRGRLYKFEGLGNDFLVSFDADLFEGASTELVANLTDRHRGVGADGLIFGLPGRSPGVDLEMVLFNNDGSRAQISGNGIRCLAHAARLFGLVKKDSFLISTDAGVREVGLLGVASDEQILAQVSMGMVEYLCPAFSKSYSFNGKQWLGTDLDIGNPHLVLVLKDQMDQKFESRTSLDELDLAALGMAIENEYPNGTNVEWLAINPEASEVTMRVWERGVGITQACGSGSSAAGFLVIDQGIRQGPVSVVNPGGVLSVSIRPENREVILRGNSSFVGTIELARHFNPWRT